MAAKAAKMSGAPFPSASSVTPCVKVKAKYRVTDVYVTSWTGQYLIPFLLTVAKHTTCTFYGT